MERRQSYAASLRDTLKRPGRLYEARVLAAAEELEALASELDDEELELDPACAVACMRLLSDVVTSPLLNRRCRRKIFARASSRSGPASRPGGWLPRLQAGLRRDLGEVAGLGLRPRAPRDTGVLRRLGDSLRDRRRDPPVEDTRHDVVGGQLVVRDDSGQRLGGRKLHRRRDLACPYVERSAEDAGESEHVVDLVRVVRPAGRDYGRDVVDLLGMTSGVGFAIAKTIALSAIRRTASTLTAPGAERPM